ncbi:MAG: phenylalanine--tRNA ligase beta subunit-related protein, partial [Candidatus Paceibacteria bacterium]
YYGVSREIANLTGKELKTPERTVPEESGSYTIKRDAELCKRYLTLEATTVSHLLMPRLRDIGELSNSPLVDLSNYVMEEMGQPVHIFDTRKLSGSQITIRTAEPGEGFVALGEQQLVLTEDDIVITDEEKIIALAGVIGGESSKVDEYTDSIVVESAQFNSAYVQRTARRLNLLTDAAKRFEKGLPVESARMGIERVAWYLEQMQQFVVKEGDARMDVSEFSWHLEQERLSLGGITDEGTSQTEHTPVALSSSQVRSYLGVNIEDERIQQYLEQIECTVTNTNDGGFWGGSSESAEFEVTPPYYRLDLTTPEELIEEVGRLYGYDDIPAETSHISLKVAEKNPFYELCKQLRYSLKALGYNEV